MNTEKKIFRSRISILLLCCILGVLIPVVLSVFKRDDVDGACVTGGVLLVLLFSFSGVRYIFSGSRLLIKI